MEPRPYIHRMLACCVATRMTRYRITGPKKLRPTTPRVIIKPTSACKSLAEVLTLVIWDAHWVEPTTASAWSSPYWMLTLSKWQNLSSVIDVFIFVLQDISTGQFANAE